MEVHVRLQRLIPAFVLVGSLAAASVASAATFGAQVYGAFNTYAMGEWNDAIDEANAMFGNDFDNVGSGLTGGVEVRMWANSSWLVAAGWEPLFLDSEDSVSGSEVNLNAHAITVTGGYFFPTTGSARYGVAAGLGLYINAGELNSPGTSVDVRGNDVGFHLLGLGEWTVSPGFAVTAGAGYRIAKLSESELTDGTNTVDSPYDNDYSGLIARVGLVFYMASGQ